MVRFALPLVIAALTAGAARAEPAKTLRLDFGAPRAHAAPIASRTPDAPRTFGPRRDVDLRFDDKVTGLVGFLCGREPGQTEYGAASAFGHDPQGRFLGARLSRSF